QRMLAGKAASDPTPRAEEGGQGEAAAKAAEQLNVGRNIVYLAQQVVRDGTPELQQAVGSGLVSVKAAADLASLPKKEQKKAVAEGKQALMAKVKEVRQQKAGGQRQEGDSRNGKRNQQSDSVSSPGKGPQKETPTGAQPASPEGKNCITLDLNA